MKVKEESEKAGLKLNIQKTKIMVSYPNSSQQIDEEKGKQWHILFSLPPKSLQIVTVAMKLRYLILGRKNYDKNRQGVKKQRHHFAINGPYSQSYCLSSSPVWM